MTTTATTPPPKAPPYRLIHIYRPDESAILRGLRILLESGKKEASK